ncbi:MAG: hypothetical protein AB9866_28710 [Syntrophobacteraceae bacterium]
MEWIVYILAFLAGLIVLGILALQVLHAIAEYHERAGRQGARDWLSRRKKSIAPERGTDTRSQADDKKNHGPMARSFTEGFTSQNRY